jgi:hypothetical protein
MWDSEVEISDVNIGSKLAKHVTLASATERAEITAIHNFENWVHEA